MGLTGCYPVHTIDKYHSKDDYYKKANLAFEGKEVNVNLVQSDSSFLAEEAVIRDDSISMTISKEWETKKLQRSDIKSAVYYNKDYDNLCAHLKLLSGDTLNLEKIAFNPDSSIEYQVLTTKTVRLPLKEIKTIRYKNYRGIPLGFALGTIGGLLTGTALVVIASNNRHANISGRPSGEGQDDPGPIYFVGSCILGPIFGTATGCIVGGRTTWEFNK